MVPLVAPGGIPMWQITESILLCEQKKKSKSSWEQGVDCRAVHLDYAELESMDWKYRGIEKLK